MSTRRWLIAAIALLLGWRLLVDDHNPGNHPIRPQVDVPSPPLNPTPLQVPAPPSPAVAPKPKRSEEFVYVTTAGAKLYSGPDEETYKVATLKAGAKLLLVDRLGSWLYVRDPVSGKAGYLSGNAVSYTPPAAKAKQPKKALRLSDQAIKQSLIDESIMKYPGSCPCPYNADRAGRSCGRRSAYSRPGGYSPLCYPADITAEMVERYRQTH